MSSLTGALDPQLCRAFNFTKDAFSLKLTKSAREIPFVFTDGAVEPSADGQRVLASVGGILYNSEGMAEAFFSEEVLK